jgi:hypothetical protein
MSWISVETILPEVWQPVLLGNASWPRSCIGVLTDPEVRPRWLGYLDMSDELPPGDPTHWQPLPEVPHE